MPNSQVEIVLMFLVISPSPYLQSFSSLLVVKGSQWPPAPSPIRHRLSQLLVKELLILSRQLAYSISNPIQLPRHWFISSCTLGQPFLGHFHFDFSHLSAASGAFDIYIAHAKFNFHEEVSLFLNSNLTLKPWFCYLKPTYVLFNLYCQSLALAFILLLFAVISGFDQFFMLWFQLFHAYVPLQILKIYYPMFLI